MDSNEQLLKDLQNSQGKISKELSNLSGIFEKAHGVLTPEQKEQVEKVLDSDDKVKEARAMADKFKFEI